MKQPVKMPALSDTMEAGRLLRWMKQTGDIVSRGDVLAEVETDKAVMDMEAFQSGVLIGPLVSEDQEYPVGEVLAWIGDEEESQVLSPTPETSEMVPEEKVPKESTPKARTKVEEPAPMVTGNETKASQAKPGAMKKQSRAGKSHEMTDKMTTVLTQALEGRSMSRHPGEDAEASLLRELEAGPPYQIAQPSRLRQVVGTTMSQAALTPQFRVSTQLDLRALKDLADKSEASFTLLLAKACALAISEHHLFNAAWTPKGLAQRERVDVAIAMEAEHGLLTPVVRDVAGRSIPELAQDWRALKENIKHHRMAPEDYRGATFYLSNMGMFPDVMQFDAVVPPGATAILAVAAPVDSNTVLTLTCDHRVVFGTDAARFLATLKEQVGQISKSRF